MKNKGTKLIAWNDAKFDVNKLNLDKMTKNQIDKIKVPIYKHLIS